MAPSIKSPRGIYHVTSAAPPERADEAWVLTLALERADGIEKIALRCRVRALSGESVATAPSEQLLRRIASAIQRDFEHVREEALRSIRSERRLHEIELEAPE